MGPAGTASRWATSVAVAVVLGACGQPLGAAAPERPASLPTPTPRTVPRPHAVEQVSFGGTVSAAASRLPSIGVGATCDIAVVDALSARHPEVGQWIVTTTETFASTAGSTEVVVRRADGTWACQRSDQAALVGRTGTRPLAERRSGDGSTPAGAFPLGTATAWDGQVFQFFGNGPDPGVRGAYRAVQPGDCWGANPGEATYNHLYRNTSCTRGDDEYLPSMTGSYVHAALIGANGEPDVSGDGAGEVPFAAAIFLHRHAYAGSEPKPTSGCVSLALDDLIATLSLIDPARAPHFAIGPRDWLLSSA